jgi:hypothetical protein
MSDWRTMMQEPFASTHYPHNPQKGSQGSDSEDCEDIESGIKGAMHVPDWLTRWRELAQVTSGLEADDPRTTPVLATLAECQRAHEAGDMDAFTKAAARVRRLMQFAPGATIRWEGRVNHRRMVLGPAVIEYVHHADGKLYVFVVWKGIERWVSETIITKIEGPKS